MRNPEDERAEVEMGEAIAFYHELYLETGLGAAPPEVKLHLRAEHVAAVKKNPVALWQVATWWAKEGKSAFEYRIG